MHGDLAPLYSYMRRYRWQYVQGTLACVSTNIVAVFFPLILGWAINAIQKNHATREMILEFAGLLVGISLSAPVCLGLFVLDKNHMTESLLTLCLCRLVASPFVLVGIGVSRVVARFDRAKKLTSYALLIEGLSLGIAIAMLIRAALGTAAR